MARLLSVAVAILALSLAACHSQSQPGPTSPTSAPFSSTPFSGLSSAFTPQRIGAARVDFPPQNEPVDFLNQLESRYQNQLRRGPVATFIDAVGHAVWLADYIRYRVNLCSHAEAVSKVLTRVNTAGSVDPPECGSPPAGPIPFPPQNEPVAFLTQLESTYRDQLRRPALNSFVDATGQAVWMADYLRYRLNACGHADAVSKVMQRVDSAGSVDPPVCTGPVIIDPPPTTIVARPGGPYGPVNAYTPITVNGLASTSSPNAIRRYIWTCGQTGNTACNKEGGTVQFTYIKNGQNGTTVNYTVTLVVEDTAGKQSAPATTTVRVTNIYQP